MDMLMSRLFMFTSLYCKVMIVKMYMSKKVKTIEPNASLNDAVKLMRTFRIRRLVVVQDGEILGILCHRDLTTAAEQRSAGKAVSKVLHVMKSPVRTIAAEEPVEKAAMLMTRFHIGGLPVVNKGELVGIITESDIFRALTSLLAGNGNSARITFDITNGSDVLKYLVDKSNEMKLDIRSFLTFEDGERMMAVARVRGHGARAFVDELWDSGHTVVNIIWLD